MSSWHGNLNHKSTYVAHALVVGLQVRQLHAADVDGQDRREERHLHKEVGQHADKGEHGEFLRIRNPSVVSSIAVRPQVNGIPKGFFDQPATTIEIDANIDHNRADEE